MKGSRRSPGPTASAWAAHASPLSGLRDATNSAAGHTPRESEHIYQRSFLLRPVAVPVRAVLLSRHNTTGWIC